MRLLPALLALPFLAACSLTADSDKNSAKVSVPGVDVASIDGKASIEVGGESGFRIDSDGFKAALDIKGMDIGSKNFDIDGMKLYPGTKVGGMSIDARDDDSTAGDTVKVSFFSPVAPGLVLDFAAKEAAREGVAVSRSQFGLTGDAKDKQFVYLLAAEGTGSRGTLTIIDKSAG